MRRGGVCIGVLVLLAVAASGVVSKTYKFKQDGLDLTVELSSETARIIFEVPYHTVDKSLVFHLKTDQGECPGYAYWFSKDNVKLPALTVASGCEPKEPNIRIRYELAKDFGKRTLDQVDGDTYKFDGQLYYDESISKFQLDSYKKIRIIKTSQAGVRDDKTYPLS